jgi:hypothetical protein
MIGRVFERPRYWFHIDRLRKDMTSEQETRAKPLPSELADKLREAARRLWLFVNSEYHEGDGTKTLVRRRHLDTIHALRAIAADIAFCPDYVLESGSDQRSAMEHAISLLRYTVDWLDEDRAEALASELEGRVAEGDEAMKP